MVFNEKDEKELEKDNKDNINSTKGGKIIGIDLGTVNSCVGYKGKIIYNASGDRTTPSVVCYPEHSNESPEIGMRALNQQVLKLKNTINFVKRMVGMRKDIMSIEDVRKKMAGVAYDIAYDKNDNISVKIGDKYKTVEEIQASILLKLKKDAEAFLGEEVTGAVITVPAYYNDTQRQSTINSGKIAGLTVHRIINEPTAAALAYDIKSSALRNVVIYDLGGGTFDISLLQMENDVLSVKATNGNARLGGFDFDNKLKDRFVEIFNESNRGAGVFLDVNSKDKDTLVALGRIREEAEKLKKQLSSCLEVPINIPFLYGGKHLSVDKFYRSEFENLIRKLVESTKEQCSTVVKDSGIPIEDIHDVVLVGGSTRIPLVQEFVKNFFGGKKPKIDINPDEAVALGAARQADILSGEDGSDLLLLDVTPLSLGIETLGGVFTIIIEKNTTIPTRKSQVFSTAEDNQSAVTISVFQGERKIAVKNHKLGTFNLEGIPPAPKGRPQIEVIFDIDANGVINISAVDKATNKSQKITVNSGSLDKDEIERMIRDRELHSEEDDLNVEFQSMVNDSRSLIDRAKALLKDSKDKLNKLQIGDIEKGIEEMGGVLHNFSDGEPVSDRLGKIKPVYEKYSKIVTDIGGSLYSQEGPTADPKKARDPRESEEKKEESEDARDPGAQSFADKEEPAADDDQEKSEKAEEDL